MQVGLRGLNLSRGINTKPIRRVVIVIMLRISGMDQARLLHQRVRSRRNPEGQKHHHRDCSQTNQALLITNEHPERKRYLSAKPSTAAQDYPRLICMGGIPN